MASAGKINLYKFRYRPEVDGPAVGNVWRRPGEFYIGVMAQEVQAVRPDCAFVGADGILRVDYDRLGAPFMRWDDWEGERGAAYRMSGNYHG
jgi:hypothetical protein